MSKTGPFAEPIAKEVLQKVSEVARRIEIQEIRLVEALVSMNGVPSPATAEFSAEHKVESAERDGETLTVRLGLKLSVKSPDEGSSEVVLFGAIYRLVYSSASMSEMPEEGVSHFANTNSVHNAWPYWREYVQSMAGRMGLPLLTLPLLKMQPPPKVETKPHSDSAQNS